MPNLFSMFSDLIPSDPLVVGEVTSSSGDTHVCTLIDGGIVVVRGKASAGQKVFIKGDLIQGVAPNLTLEVIDV